jgi:putative hydrolase of the HAD superfamily
MLKAVTFDCWQTLVLDRSEGLRQAREGRVRGVQEALARAGIAIEVAAVDAAYDAVGERLQRIWGMQRDVGSRGQVRLLLECLGIDGSVPTDSRLMDALDDAYCLPILSALPIPNAGAQEALRVLHAHGLRLGLICNTGRTPGRMLRLVLERLGLASYLSAFTFSDELGLRKPHPTIFLRTLSALDVAPADAAHVGDGVTTDVAGARAIGMRAIHLCHAAGATGPSESGETISRLAVLTELLFSSSR